MTTKFQDFEGKVALVTGGASGIGKACVEEFASRGASVVISDLNEELGNEFVAQLEAQGIRVNAVCPGYIETPMTAASIPPEMKQRLLMMHPIGRLGKPEDVARSVAYLCSENSAFVTGTAHQVDGGYTCH